MSVRNHVADRNKLVHGLSSNRTKFVRTLQMKLHDVVGVGSGDASGHGRMVQQTHDDPLVSWRSPEVVGG